MDGLIDIELVQFLLLLELVLPPLLVVVAAPAHLLEPGLVLLTQVVVECHNLPPHSSPVTNPALSPFCS